MNDRQSSVSYFNERGRRILTRPYRVFDTEDLDYYFIQNKEVDLANTLQNFHDVAIGKDITLEKFKTTLENLKNFLLQFDPVQNLFSGVHIPFIVPQISEPAGDLSHSVIERFLPYLESSFKRCYPKAHFKAIVQGGSSLNANLKIAERSRYQELLDCAKKSNLIGWYFPQALQQFDIDSQVEQIEELPKITGMCLSGPAEILSANIGKPNLLINTDGYAPILTMPGVQHMDDRLTLALKSYGPHLEFWCMSNELLPGVKQVSEQWSGGITLFSNS